jgi:hypothetical protein
MTHPNVVPRRSVHIEATLSAIVARSTAVDRVGSPHREPIVQAIGRQPQRAPDGAKLQYECHRPEQSTLYRLVQQHAASFIPHAEASTGGELPGSSRTSPTASLSPTSGPMASSGCAAASAARTSCWPSTASGAGSARHAARGACRRPRRTWWTTSSHMFRCDRLRLRPVNGRKTCRLDGHVRREAVLSGVLQPSADSAWSLCLPLGHGEDV